MDEHGNLAIVRSIIGLAHSLGHQVVAEGIETMGQLEELAGLSCDLGQGFYYARPMDEGQATSLLDRYFGKTAPKQP